ncbi:methyltransferase [Marinomonas ostreistagni]|uniref:methyltransferase n=1 Tax=Marinomonas ostreistagni TaxID=359209 RepID=UPI00194E9834|nr:methyltransferase [Marinomonas ostreistagni]MBM6551170.1 methyltransferase [Marinomonas ostreistagni]
MTSSFAQAFLQHDHWLTQHRPLWDVQSFHHLDWPWQETYPALCQWLSEQTEVPSATEVEAALARLVPEYGERPAWPFAATENPISKAAPPSYFEQGIKGRKWQQILALSDAIELISPTVEWCAGKGHLGKVLAFQHETQVHSLEWQPSLCEAGTAEAKRLQVAQTFTHADVLKGEGQAALEHANSAVALHACGDLHRVLLEQGVAAALKRIAISPCCYHLTQDAHYRPLSIQGQRATTRLSKDNLKLAVKEVATAGLREQRLKQLELSYRLGFDSWQRDVTGVNQYLAVPSCPKALLQEGFFAFCHWAAEQKSLPKPTDAALLSGYETIGQQRSQHVAMIESITQHFRQALERWLVLDRALYLEENGYQVSIREFCPVTLTPRNLLIYAYQ